MACTFCDIVSARSKAHVVWSEEATVAFLDNRPLFPGHVLVVPREHVPTIAEIPSTAVGPLFRTVQRVAAGVQSAMGAEGTFIALNNRVSQSVPHLHVHVVPRRKGDGLRGFFWPRNPYRDVSHMDQTRDAIRRAIESPA